MAKGVDKNHPDYKGELTGKHLRDGPLHERKCTDFFCLILFLAFWGGMGFIAFFAFQKGDPWAITYVYDQNGVKCRDLDGYNYLYFIKNSTSDTNPYSLTNTICVQNCPANAVPNCDPTSPNATLCPTDPVNTTTFLQRVCLPVNVGDQQELHDQGLNFGFFAKASSDLMATWPMILAVGGFALVFGFVYILLMKYFSGVLIWGILWAIVLGVGGFGYVAFSTDPESTTTGMGGLSANDLKAIAYSCWGFAAVFLLVIILLHSRISLSIAILKAAAHFIQDEPGILIVPPIFLVFTLGFYVLWTAAAAYIVGLNDIGPKDRKPYADIDWTPEAGGMMAYYIFALLWNHAIGIAISQFIVASTVCLWYFKQGSKKCGVSPVKASLARTVTHMGSLAFGSFLIGILEFVKFILHYVERKLKSVPAGEDAKTGFFVGCCTCVVSCFERSMKFLTTHAYVQIAMTGESFCKATLEATFLALRNAVRFAMVHVFAWLFLKLGQLLVAGAATVLGYIIITHSSFYQERVISPLIPTIFFFLSAYIVAHAFMNIYGMSADTIVHCFAMDEEIHDGNVVHAPEELREYVDNHPLNKKLLTDDQ